MTAASPCSFCGRNDSSFCNHDEDKPEQCWRCGEWVDPLYALEHYRSHRPITVKLRPGDAEKLRRIALSVDLKPRTPKTIQARAERVAEHLGPNWLNLRIGYSPRDIGQLSADARMLLDAVRNYRHALEQIRDWSVPVDDPDPDDPQTEYGQIKKFCRHALGIIFGGEE